MSNKPNEEAVDGKSSSVENNPKKPVEDYGQEGLISNVSIINSYPGPVIPQDTSAFKQEDTKEERKARAKELNNEN